MSGIDAVLKHAVVAKGLTPYPDGRPASVSVRGEAQAFLREQLALSAAGSGRVVLVSGGVASGKTGVLHEFLDHAAESGVLTLTATGAPDEQRLSAGVIDQMFTNSALPPEMADQVADILAATDAIRPAEHQSGPQTSTPMIPLTRGICQILLRCFRERPVVLAVDDVQFADDSSLRLILQLQRRIRSVRMLIVLARCDPPNTADPTLHAHLTRLPHHHIRLAPLSEQAIGDLAAESLGVPLNGELVARLHELTAGNPMLVNALIEDYRGGDRHGSLVVGPAFSHAVLTFLHRWDSPLREVAGAIAVLGEPSSPDLVARLAEVTADVAGDMMTILAGVGLLSNGSFRHASAAAAALDSLSPAARAQLYLRAAEVKHHRASSAEEVAAHLIAAGQAPGGWPIRVLREAAEQAALADNVRFAGQCLELASAAATDTAERRAILSSLARITWRVNPSAAAAYLAALHQADPAAPPELAEPVTLARQSLWNGDDLTFGRAMDMLRESPDTSDPRTDAELGLACYWHFGAGAGTENTNLAARRGDPWQHTAATLARVWTVGPGDATTASAERILRNCPLADTTLEALATAILALAYDNRVERAEYWCATLSEQAARRGAVTWQALLDSVWANVTLRHGDVETAAGRARAALALLGTQGWGVSISHPLTTLLMADTATGAFDAAAGTLRQPVPDAMFQTVGGLRYLRARGRYHLATDRVLAAISDFQQCRRLMVRRNMDLPVLVPWRTDLAEANLRLGNVALAQELAQQQIDQTTEADASSRGAALRILALAGSPAERPALLAKALEQFERSGDRLEMARVLKVPGSGQHPPRRPEPGQSAQPVRIPGQRTARSAAPAGASGSGIAAMTRPPAPEARAAVATRPPVSDVVDPAGLPGPDSETAESSALSQAELRVAQLAASGKTNRQIGNSLFITISTVEQHLTRVYRKLGIRGRSELPTQLTSTA
ncbi:helix-turn-helix transcriptional regulator [Phytohabitans kaempferiae]|uniref:AAA family ATPase n=1 Tax=Phytohabitans kaempferiae TaxID=1620943 RepID=A0ABV6M3A0_9ACTN